MRKILMGVLLIGFSFTASSEPKAPPETKGVLGICIQNKMAFSVEKGRYAFGITCTNNVGKELCMSTQKMRCNEDRSNCAFQQAYFFEGAKCQDVSFKRCQGNNCTLGN